MINAPADSTSVAEERRRLFKLRLAQKGIVPPRTESIRRRERSGPMPLSFAQQRLWFIDQLHPGSTLYNLPLALRLSGVLNVRALNHTFTRLVARHESLRTAFTTQNGEPVQVIHPAQATLIPLIDLTELPEQVRGVRGEQLLRAAAEEPFDLSSGPLLRALLVRLQATEHVVLLTMHHIISDGWSLGVLVREVSELYEAYVAGREPQLAELEVQYGDYAAWQREWLSGPVLEQQLQYWRQQLNGNNGTLDILGDHVRPAIASHRGGVEGFEITRALAEGLRRVSREETVTLFMLLLAAWQSLLFRYSGNSDVLIGTPIANRNRRETEGLIGFFVNTLVIRSRVSGELRFTELLQQVRDTALAAYAHQDVPFEKLVEEFQPERGLSHHPLFQISFQLQNAPLGTLELTGLRLSPIDLGGGMAKFDLALQMQETNGELVGLLEYATDLFEGTTIKRMVAHYINVLEGVVADREQTISHLPLLTKAELDQLIAGWNQTKMAYPSGACVHQFFEAQVRRTPESLAVVMNDEQLTYAELNASAHRLAGHLQSLGVGPEVLVGICVERSPKMLVGILAILKAGGAYVPLDPAYPKERLALMVEDSGIAVMLTERHLQQYLPAQAATVVCVDDTLGVDAPLVEQVASDNLAYVIYTSGSTGRPKGVHVSHRNLVHSTSARFAYYEEPVGVFLLLSSFAFDSSVAGIFWTLSQGGCLVLPEPGLERDPLQLGSLVADHNVTHLLCLPSLHGLVLKHVTREKLASLRVVIVAGESCPRELLTLHYDLLPDTTLFNEYGPTEGTVWSTVSTCRLNGPSAQVPIGRPIPNMQVFLLDRVLNIVPLGVVGELYISGEGLARGYLNRPDVTAERFIPHPYSEEPGARLYRTGDTARYLENGEIEFIGRSDNQVKLRGFRIELGEIEAVLNEFPGVNHSVVVMRGDSGGNRRLVAYLVSGQGIQLENSELRSVLAERLPEYMVPSAFVQMEQLPLTPSGKVDRNALPDPGKSQGELAPAYVAPRNISELWLTQIWEQILDIRPVGVTSSFFELGGHSLLAVRLMESIKERWGRELPLTTLFQYPTIEKFAALLRDREEVYSAPLVGLQTDGSKRAFFCVHAVGGSVFPYLSLREYLGPDQPLYGLQSPGLESDVPPLERVEEMANCYLAALRTVQPEGPYLLGGWSMGGLIAYEMAQQLQAQGESVDLLVLIDSISAPPELVDLNDEWTALKTLAAAHNIALENLDLEEQYVRKLGSDEMLDHVFERVRTAKLIPSDIGVAQVRRILKVLHGNMEAMQNYVSKPLKNRIHLIRAVDPATPDQFDLTLGWAELATELEVATVEGNHFNLLREPQVTVVGNQLKLWLSEAQSRDSSLVHAALPQR